jgi:microcystin-dependent protein
MTSISTQGKALYAWTGSEWIPLNGGTNFSTIQRWNKIFDGGETIISGNDENNNLLIYTPGYEQVYLNGILLVRNEDYTATDGVEINLSSPLNENDVLDIIIFIPLNIGNTYTRQQSDARYVTAEELESEINDILDGAPEALDTLNELSAALNNDENFASTVISTITSASAYALSEVNNSLVHQDHVGAKVEYNETSNRIVIDAGPTGMISPFAGSTSPTGWLLCAGQNISRTTYANLFSVIGTTYGSGDGSTTFAVPDLRGRVVAALDNMGGTDAGRLDLANNLGTSAGSQTHTLTTAELASHTHSNSLGGTTTFASSTHTHGRGTYAAAIGAVASNAATIGYQAGSVVSGGPTASTYDITGTQGSGRTFSHYTPVYGVSATPSATATVSISNAASGSGNAHNNMQPTILLNYIIKV